MPSDVQLTADDVDLQADASVFVSAPALRVTGTDIFLDNTTRHTGPPGTRRALVHDVNNANVEALVLNFGGDYPGGVAVHGSHLEARQLHARQVRVINPNASPDEGAPGGRALTHSDDDALVLNELGFYSAGVRVEGKHLAVQRLRVVNPNASKDTGSPGGRALAHSDDDALIVNEDGTYKGGVRVQGSHLAAKQLHAEQVHARQIRLINPNASPDADAPGGRALTHSDKDALVLNEGGFYSAGVTVEGSLNVSKLQAHGLGSLIALLPGAALPGQPSTPLPLDIIKELLELRH